MQIKRLQTFLLASIAALLVGGFLLSAVAADRVYLRSGSDLVCDHMATYGSQVRLFLTPSGDSYLDIDAGDVLRSEPVAVKAEIPSLRSAPAGGHELTAEPTPMELSALLHHAGAEHHIDPDLLASVVRAESAGHSRAISRAGAQGLMQLMPGTAADLGVRDSFASEQNVTGGTTYLDALLMYYHEDLALALAAYNAGPAAVARYHGIPPYAATRRYVASVIHDYNQRKKREATAHPPATAIAAVAHP